MTTFAEPLGNNMAGGPTRAAFKLPDGASGSGSGVVPPPDAPEAPTLADAVAVTAQTGTGSDPATITMLNAKITEINAALTVANDNVAALQTFIDWQVQSGALKPPAA